MPIIFKDAFVHNNNPAFSIEDVYLSQGAFGGVYAFEFDSLINDTFSSLDDWTDTESIWELLGGMAVGVATGLGSGYGELWHDESTPSSFSVLGLLNENSTDGNCIIFRGDGNDNYYLLEINQSTCGFYRIDDGSVTALSVLAPNLPLNTGGVVELSVWQQQYSDEAEDRYLFMTFCYDGRTILSAYDHISETVPGLRWGLAAKNGNNVFWERVRIPDLSTVIEWTSLDSNESPMASIKRAIGDRIINILFRRYALYAWRPIEQAVDYVIPADNIFSLRKDKDTREPISHVRMQYASGWVDAFDEDLLLAYGHVFREEYNADIYTEEEAYTEALAVLRRSKEQAFQREIELIDIGYLLEPEDRIQLPDGTTWIVDSLSIDVKQGARVTIRARRYAY